MSRKTTAEAILSEMSDGERERLEKAFEEVGRKFRALPGNGKPLAGGVARERIAIACNLIEGFASCNPIPAFSAMTLHVCMRDAALYLSDESLSKVMHRIVGLLLGLPLCCTHFEAMLGDEMENAMPEGRDQYRQRFVRAYVEALVSYALDEKSGIGIFLISVRIVELSIAFPWCMNIVRLIVDSERDRGGSLGNLRGAIDCISLWIMPEEETEETED